MFLFQNLRVALEETRRREYEVAAYLKINPVRFSQKCHGNGSFSAHEREMIAEYLGYQEAWLFQRVTAPASARLSPDSAKGQRGEIHGKETSEDG